MSRPPNTKKLRIEARKREQRRRKELRRLAKRSGAIPPPVSPAIFTLVQAPADTNSTFPQPSRVQMIRPKSSRLGGHLSWVERHVSTNQLQSKPKSRELYQRKRSLRQPLPARTPAHGSYRFFRDPPSGDNCGGPMASCASLYT